MKVKTNNIFVETNYYTKKIFKFYIFFIYFVIVFT